MINFLLILTAIGISIFLLTRYILEKQKKAVLESLYKDYIKLFDKFNLLPRELKGIIADVLRRIKISIKEIEEKYPNYKKSSDVFDFVDLKIAQGKELERQIADNKKKFEIFDSFMKEVGYTKLSIENLQKDIKRKAEDITLSFGEKTPQQKQKDRFIQEQTDKVTTDLDLVYIEFDKLQGKNYQSFDLQDLRDLEKLKEIVVKDGEDYYSLISYFNKEITISLVGIARRSTFYIKIKELLEGYQRGKNKMANLGEVTVSFKTFEKLEEGSRYRQDIFVSSKRAVQEIEAAFNISIGEEGFNHMEELTYDELLDLLNIAQLKPSDEENDENGIAYNFEIVGIEIILGKKEKQELLVQYVRDLNLLTRIPIKD